MKTLFKVLLLLTLPVAAQAQFNAIDNGDGTATITGYTGPGGAVIIPDTILVGSAYLPVSSIGGSAFYYASAITSITIPSSVTNIEDYAFESLHRLDECDHPQQRPQPRGLCLLAMLRLDSASPLATASPSLGAMRSLGALT